MPGHGRQIALDVARGLHFLHRHFVVHFRLEKPQHSCWAATTLQSPLLSHLCLRLSESWLWRTLSCLQLSVSWLWQTLFTERLAWLVDRIADVGLARLLQKDYISSLQSVGTFAWSVRILWRSLATHLAVRNVVLRLNDHLADAIMPEYLLRASAGTRNPPRGEMY